MDDDIHTVTAFHCIGGQDGLLIEGHKESFTDDKIGPYVSAGNCFGFISDATKQGGRGDFSCLAR